MEEETKRELIRRLTLNRIINDPDAQADGAVQGAFDAPDEAFFGTPEETYRNKSICVTGRIQSYRGEPEIIASDPAQLSANAP